MLYLQTHESKNPFNVIIFVVLLCWWWRFTEVSLIEHNLYWPNTISLHLVGVWIPTTSQAPARESRTQQRAHHWADGEAQRLPGWGQPIRSIPKFHWFLWGSLMFPLHNYPPHIQKWLNQRNKHTHTASLIYLKCRFYGARTRDREIGFLCAGSLQLSFTLHSRCMSEEKSWNEYASVWYSLHNILQ